MAHLLDNIVWHTLYGPHAKYATGTDEARRYAPGFPSFIGFSNIDNPNFHSLAPYVKSDEHLYCDGWAGAAPAGWRIESESIMIKMIWQGSMPIADEMPEAVLLGPQHASAALELAALTRPGPFSLGSIELGRYFGIFDGPRLIAMAGGRRCVDQFREISGVCTHPEFRARGLARRLIVKLIRHHLLCKEMPFLRVMRASSEAHGFYQRMGFRDYRESVARVIARY